MFLDKVKIKVESGNGGNGMVAFRREKYVDKGGPYGGDGGRGGDIYLIADNSISTLLDFKYKSIFKAQNGENGRTKNQHGKGGEDLYIKVPLGTVVKDVNNNLTIADLKVEGQKVLIAKGGRGGRGNSRFATPQKRAPQFCEPGESGIIRELELELKLIADVGLLGMPNAGKSTFISVISDAKPKIANYAFTTLKPNLGVVKKQNGDSFVVADIPGIIEGASLGVGLGFQFLRHVERCRFLVHIIDASCDSPLENYHKINEELKKYSQHLSDLYQIIALNKTDLIDVETQQNLLKEFKKFNNDVFLISAATKTGVKELLNFISLKTTQIEKSDLEIDIDFDNIANKNDDSEFYVQKLGKNCYCADGGKIRRLVSVTDERNLDQTYRLHNILDAMSVFDALKQLGLKDGDSVFVGGRGNFYEGYLVIIETTKNNEKKAIIDKTKFNTCENNCQNATSKGHNSIEFIYYD